MPLFDYLCLECGETSEILVSSADEHCKCAACGSLKTKKLLSAHASISGSAGQRIPGPGDTACCGSTPNHAGCAGPGSCCGKNPF